VVYSPAGRVDHVTTRNNVEVRQGPAGSRIARQETPDHRVIVANAAGHGFVQRPAVTIGNHQYVERTYLVRGVPYTRAYRPYRYNGIVVNVYAPTRYYSRGFYVYAGTPWGTPISYRWGWNASPWYGAYGVYFTPYPVYAGPGLWLTDYLIASAFQDAYQARLDANGGAPLAANNFAAAPMPPYVKQEIADEVQRQIALEQTESQQVLAGGAPDNNGANGIPPILADGAAHTLVASSGFIVAAGSGECGITEGDVLRFNGPRAVNGLDAAVSVDWSKPGDCPIGSLVNVPVDQLQEMNNHMRETIDQGLGDLQTRQGQDGLPRVAGNLVGSTPAPFASELPPPDPGVANQLRSQAQDAGSAWAEAAPPAANQPSTQSVALGQSIKDVEGIMGPPTQSAKVGDKTIYVYPSFKITFTGGLVSDVQ
jgi:hypothetical protein